MERLPNKEKFEVDEGGDVEEESLFIRLTKTSLRLKNPTLIQEARSKISEDEIKSEISALKKKISQDRSLSKGYKKSFNDDKWREAAIMSLVLDKIDYPDGKKPTKKEAANRLLDAIFGENKDIE